MFDGVFCEIRVYAVFLTVAQHESDTRKVISWSVTVYNKNIQSMQFDC
jgi:hypothetical protein